MKVLLVTFSDNSDHQDTLFGMYEALIGNAEVDAYLMAIRTPKVPLARSDRTWLVDCPKRPGIVKKTFDVRTLGRIIRRVRKVRFDAVYFESLHVWNLPVMLSLGRSAHRYQVIHEVIPHEGDHLARGVDFMNRVVCRTADTIVLRNRRYVEEMVRRYRISRDRVRYLELWRRYPGLTPPVHSGRILFFGRINPYKGAENLLEIVRLCPELRFDVIGRVDPQMEQTAEKLEKEKNVRLVNRYVTDEEMREAFTGADWAIVPYNTASQSGIIIDAYKYSRPVIAFNVGAIAEQVDDGRSGFLVTAGDKAAFAAKLKEAAAMPPEEYDRMHRSAWEYGTEKYSAGGAVNRFIRLVTEKYGNDHH